MRWVMCAFPRIPRQRLENAWADELAENAVGVWSSMIENLKGSQLREPWNSQRRFSTLAEFEIPVHHGPRPTPRFDLISGRR